MPKVRASDPLFVELFPVRPRKGERTKYRIIMAAVDCLAAYGIDGTGFESVGKRVGMARRNVAYHFPDLEGLIVAAVQLALATGQRYAVEYLAKETRPDRQLEAYFTSTFDWFEANPAHGKIFLALYAAGALRRPELTELYDRVRLTGSQRIATILEAQAFPSDKTRHETVQAVYDLLTGAIVRYMTTRPTAKAALTTERVLAAALALISAGGGRAITGSRKRR